MFVDGYTSVMSYVCSSGKVRFANLDAANARIHEIESNPQTPYVPTRAYSCGECGGAHLTSMSSQQRSAFFHRVPTAKGSKCADCGCALGNRKVYIVANRPLCGACFAAPRSALLGVPVAQRH